MKCLPFLCNSTLISVEVLYDNKEMNVTQFYVNGSKGMNHVVINYSLTHLKLFKHYNVLFKILDATRHTIDMDNTMICKFLHTK